MTNKAIQKIQQKQQKTIDNIRIKKRNKEQTRGSTQKNTAKATIKKHQAIYNNFNTYIKDKDIQTIQQDNINAILDDYRKYLTQYKNESLSNNTINQYMIIIKKLFTKEFEYKVKIIEPLEVMKKEPKYLTHTQYINLITYIKQQIKHAEKDAKKESLYIDMMMIKLLYCTGMRIHEALKILIQDITTLEYDDNIRAYKLAIVGKGNKKRTILISAKLYDDIIRYIKDTATQEQLYLFENKKNNKPISSRTFERHFKSIAESIDADNDIAADDDNSYSMNLKPHNLRHSYAVRRIEQGTNINVLKELLGHENITTTQIYTNININRLDAAAIGNLD